METETSDPSSEPTLVMPGSESQPPAFEPSPPATQLSDFAVEPPPPPASYAPPPPQKSNNRTLIIIAVVALVLCCCCCVAGVIAWQFGDQFIEALSQM